MPLLRSLLFAPGNVARRVEKALSLAADAVIVDLEDSVAICDKEATRKPVADALAKRLKARGVDVRVAGTARMFRVRIGHYETRAAAAAAARELKAKKIDAFVTEIGGDDK